MLVITVLLVVFIFTFKSLASYIKEDPVFIKEQQLKNLDNIKQQLLYELEILKNGQT